MTHTRWTPARNVHFEPASDDSARGVQYLGPGLEGVCCGGYAHGEEDKSRTFFMPNVSVWETGGEFYAQVEVPGVSREELTVEVDTGTLRVVREAAPATEDDTEEPPEIRALRRGPFTRQVALTCEVEPEGHEAKLKDGLLTVRLKKTAPDRTRAVKVTIE